MIRIIESLKSSNLVLTFEISALGRTPVKPNGFIIFIGAVTIGRKKVIS